MRVLTAAGWVVQDYKAVNLGVGNQLPDGDTRAGVQHPVDTDAGKLLGQKPVVVAGSHRRHAGYETPGPAG